MPSGALAKKMLSAYTEIEAWKLDHDIAMDHLDMEETIAWGNRLFQGLSESEAIWHAHVLEGKIDFVQTEVDEIKANYRAWLEASEGLLQLVKRLEACGHEVAGAVDLRASCAKSRALLKSDDQFTPADAVIELRDRALEEHRAGRCDD